MSEPFYELDLPGEHFSRRVLASESVDHCFMTKLFFTQSERFAWGRWQREYSPLTSFRLTLDGAERQAEHLRSPGMSWVIKELPALVLRGKAMAVLITERDEPTPLKRLRAIGPEGPGLLALADQLIAPDNTNSLVRLVVPAKTTRPRKGPFRTYRSFTAGPGEPLRWERAPTPTRRPHAVRELVDEINRVLDLRTFEEDVMPRRR